MELQTFIEILRDNGIVVVIVLYFLWKDAKLTKENTSILNEVKALLLVLTKREQGDTDEQTN